MKTLSFIFIVITLAFFTTGFVKSTQYSSSDEKTEVYFSNKLDFNDLVKLKLDLSQKQIVVNYQFLEFDNTNKLKSIGFSVISEGIFRGSGKTTDLTKYEYGFSIDKSSNAESYFNVGLTRALH